VINETVAVVVITYNSAQLLGDLVKSLEPGFGDVAWHLTVADNASTDHSADEARKLAPDATIVETGRNGGYAAGINAGVAAAKPHTCVLVLNPDVRLEPGCVPELLAALRQPGTGIAVPRLVDRNGERIDTMRREPTVLRTLGDAFLGARRAGRIPLLGEMVTDEVAYMSERLTDWAEGSTLLVSAECWQRCAPWDESFFLYSEETDFALRARDAGFALRYTPSAHAIHLEGGSADSPRLWPLLTVNRVRLYRRRHRLAPSVAFWAAVLLREASRAAVGRRTGCAAARALVSPRQLREVPGPHSIRPA
jgi:GT2 family glycosyltransferase